ncbi:hypothetical protein D3C79_826410 [compost metagenome]
MGIEVFADFSKGFDLGHYPVYLFRGEPHQPGYMQHVLAAGKLWVETHAQLKNGRNTPIDAHLALRRLQGTGDHFQQRRLARTVLADDTDRFARFDGEADVIEDPVLGRGPERQEEPARNTLPFRTVASIGLAQVADGYKAHNESTISADARRNMNKPTIIRPTATREIIPVSLRLGTRSYTSTSW